MELGDVLQRILRRHWVLIAVLVAIGLAIPTLVQAFAQKQYQATVRVAIDASDPTSAQASAALADAAQGIVTSPGRVASALRTAHASRNVDTFAASNVSAKGVGTSGVVALSVSDRDPAVAVSVANDLARQLIEARQEVSSGDAPQLIEMLNAQIATLTSRIAELDQANAASTATANARVSQGNVLKLQHDAAVRERSALESERTALLRQNPQGQLAASVAALDAQINAADQRIADVEAAAAAVADPQGQPSDLIRLQHDEAVQERSDLQSQRQHLVETSAVRPNPTVIDPARRPTSPVASQLGSRLVLGGLFGLALGLVLAALSEAVRPNVVGAEALARDLKVPVLGKLPQPPSATKPASAELLAGHLVLAASAAGVGTVRLVSAGPPVELERMAEWFGATPALRSGEISLVEASADGAGQVTGWAMPVVYGSVNGAGSSTGLVLVAPSMLRRSELDPLTHLIAMSGWVLLGVVTYEQSRFARRRPERASSSVAGMHTREQKEAVPTP